VAGYALHPQVGLRPERFGALAYHYGNRRLTFLNDDALVAVVRSPALAADVGEALLEAGVPTDRHAAYRVALTRLADAGVLVAQD
jgi:putative mycofactocin binding protein MftB